MKKLTEERKQALIDAVIKMVAGQIQQNDLFLIEAILRSVPVKQLLLSLPKEQWSDFPEIKIKLPKNMRNSFKPK